MKMILEVIASQLPEYKLKIYKLTGTESIKIQEADEPVIVILIESSDVIIKDYYKYDRNDFIRKISLSDPCLIDKIRQMIEWHVNQTKLLSLIVESMDK